MPFFYNNIVFFFKLNAKSDLRVIDPIGIKIGGFAHGQTSAKRTKPGPSFQL
jgi:hypothetical protein